MKRIIMLMLIFCCPVVGAFPCLGADSSACELREAVGRRDIALIKTMLDLGHDVNAKCGHDTALMRAAFSNDAEIVKLLLDRKADPNIQSTDHIGNTALMTSLHVGRIDFKRGLPVVKMLLDAGVDINIKNKNGKSAVQMAVSNQCAKEVRDLVASYAKGSQ
ncbi:MAG: ankyrin repeat domain-containing protein [Desulfomonilaceae bacterium]